MNRRDLLGLVGGGAVVRSVAAGAQQTIPQSFLARADEVIE